MILLPKTAITNGTALKWRQLSNDGRNVDEWALDHVLVSGRRTNPIKDNNVIIFSEDFENFRKFLYALFLIDVLRLFLYYCFTFCRGTKWSHLSHGSVTVPDCGSIDLPGYSEQAAFFSSGSSSDSRYIETVPLDLTTAK